MRACALPAAHAHVAHGSTRAGHGHIQMGRQQAAGLVVDPGVGASGHKGGPDRACIAAEALFYEAPLPLLVRPIACTCCTSISFSIITMRLHPCIHWSVRSLRLLLQLHAEILLDKIG